MISYVAQLRHLNILLPTSIFFEDSKVQDGETVGFTNPIRLDSISYPQIFNVINCYLQLLRCDLLLMFVVRLLMFTTRSLCCLTQSGHIPLLLFVCLIP